MKVEELIRELKLGLAAGSDGVHREIAGCYIGDLMSMAMAKVEEGFVWITIQTNLNVVAVAALADAACVILADGCLPDPDMAKRAEMEEIPILTTEKSAYETAKALAALGL